jgi:hypothetical protein
MASRAARCLEHLWTRRKRDPSALSDRVTWNEVNVSRAERGATVRPATPERTQ